MNKLNYYMKRFFGKYAAMIDQKSVIKDIYSELELSPGYFTMLNLANLIALFGLLINSIAVIIGAMLISPLMGPMISFGFAFVTGDNTVWQKSLKKLVVSVIITILMAAAATYFSPLNDVTDEILARTKPNLFDLLIAFLAGSAGAAAICTKKNYLTVVPGVAIATAVIPPLSVAGFGLGIGNLYIASGGFFLFFTNFVAIVMTSCFVFFFYGFRPTTTCDIEKGKVKKRITLLLLLLFIISIPLIYTLGVTIAEAKLRKDVKNALQEIYDKKGASRLSDFTYFKQDPDLLEIEATIRTVHLIPDKNIALAEIRLADKLRRKVRFNLEQDQVVKGGLEKEVIATHPTLTDKPKPPEELMRTSRGDMLAALQIPLRKIEDLISPAQLADYAVGIKKADSRLSIHLKIRRDQPLSGEQIQWLTKIIEADLQSPVALTAETIPYVPTLIYQPGQTDLTEEMKEKLAPLKDVYAREKEIRIEVESGPEASLTYRKRMAAAKQRADTIVGFLQNRYQIPSSQMKIKITSKAVKTPHVSISMLPKEAVPEP